jgi:stage III sporulation protein AG
MGLKNRISKFSGKMTKEKWLLLLLIGVLLMILSFPLPGSQKKDKGKENQTAADSQGPGAVPLWNGDAQDPAQTGESSMFGSLGQDHMGGGSSENSEGDPAYPASASPGGEGSYETQMENRIKNLLKSVDGVGKVDVMVVLKSSSEKVVRVDRSTSSSTTREKDSGGGTREVANSQSDESTVLSGSGSNGSGNVPIIEKELSPEISGIIISAEGGGSPTIKAEISEAMEALFGLPPHKIKVLKRVE